MNNPGYRLYHYWRSSSSWRVRMALAYKGLKAEMKEIHLLNGESESAEYRSKNPAGFVPALEFLGSGEILTESLAIIRYLEDAYPDLPTLLPGTPLQRAKIWAMAEVINAGTQPIQNIPVMALHSEVPAEQKKWAQHWIHNGLSIFETLSEKSPGRFAFGNDFTLADVCLIPQIYNADRFEVSLAPFPRIQEAFENSKSLYAVTSSHPSVYEVK